MDINQEQQKLIDKMATPFYPHVLELMKADDKDLSNKCAKLTLESEQLKLQLMFYKKAYEQLKKIHLEKLPF